MLKDKEEEQMTKKDWVVLGGLAMIVGALTDAATKKAWKDAHTVATVIGGIATIMGATG